MNASDFDEDDSPVDPAERKKQFVDRLRKLADAQPDAVSNYIGHLIRGDRGNKTEWDE